MPNIWHGMERKGEERRGEKRREEKRREEKRDKKKTLLPLCTTYRRMTKFSKHTDQPFSRHF